MVIIRRDREIHTEEGGWFSARWHFSFDHYRDPEHMGVGPLRVFNDDRLIPGATWPMHPHRDVEGITYVVEGSFGHEDSVGGGGVLEPGGVQRMTLGSGALHSEQNASPSEPMRFLQFWLLPDTPGLPPGVEQRQFTRQELRGGLRRVLGPEGGDVVRVHQDASAFVGILGPGDAWTWSVDAHRGLYLYLIEGEAMLDGEPLSTGDAATVRGSHDLHLEAVGEAHAIAVDVPLAFERVGVWAR